jgi:NADH-quinone oxidoreductase subunit C
MEFLKTIKSFAKEKKITLTSINVEGFVAAYQVKNGDLLSILKFVKEDKALCFSVLTDLFAADFPERTDRFEVVYSLLSLKLNKRILFKVTVPEEQNLDSLASIYPAACWYEREVFDMFGITFDNSPDMRRILTDYGFVGHPLRKDFPLTGHLQVRYDEKLEQVVYEPVSLVQEFRNFDFASPWQGGDKMILPGDEKAVKK